MKTYQKLAIVIAASVSAYSSTGQAQTLVYEYKFNDAPGTSSASTGSAATSAYFYNTAGAAADLHGGSGSGVSGLSGDLAFDNTASTRMGGVDSIPSGGRAQVADSNALDFLSSFTLSGWFKIDPTITGAYANGRLITKNTGFFDNLMVLSNSRNVSGDGRLEFSLGTSTISATTINSSYNSLLGESDWVFFAVTYDSTLASNNIKFYTGTTDDTVVLVSEHTYLAGLTGDNNATLFFGANAASNIRPFDGWLDNMRIFKNEAGIGNEGTGALSLFQLEAYRALDTIPEPSVIGLAILGLGVLLSVRRRR